MKRLSGIVAIVGFLWTISSSISAFSQEHYRFERSFPLQPYVFTPIRGVAADPTGNVYVLDSRIQKFDPDGRLIWKLESPSTAIALTVDAEGNLYLVAYGVSLSEARYPISPSIQKFDPSGKRVWYAEGLLTWYAIGGGWPNGVTTNVTGDIYVANRGMHLVEKLDSAGKFIAQWGGEGTGDGQFVHPTGIAADRSGNVYVADSGNHRIQKFDPYGRFIAKWGERGSGEGQFEGPGGVAIDPSENVIVVDSGNHRI